MNAIRTLTKSKTVSRIVHIGWVMLLCLAVAGVNPAPVPVQAQSQEELPADAGPPTLAPVVWRDDFNGALDPAWSWTNENPAKWNLTENPGFLRIYAANLGTGSENLLLRPVTPGDFAIETRVLFQPDTNFQIAGLVIFQDADNFIQFGRAFCDIPGGCLGNAIYFDYVQDGGLVGGNSVTTVNSDGEAFLRLERRADQVKGYFSYEGVTWFPIGEHFLPPGFTVNGVGLTAAQDSTTSDPDIPADFDYFELSEGSGFLPEGVHDWEQEDVPRWNCSAGGWAVDPDDRDTDLQVEILVDDVPLPSWVLADQYRQDLDDLGLCVAGSCGFNTDLWGQMTSYESHSVQTFAQDIPSGDWVLLSASPKELTCRSYDIYVLDTQTGLITQTTDLRDSFEFNPRWSPDGTQIAHDRWSFDFSTNLGIHITQVASGVSAPLAGAEDGNYPTWSPDGQLIAFNQGDDLYTLPPAGGTPSLVSQDAFIASWAPNSQRLVFSRPSDGSLWTSDLSGLNGTLVAPKGETPAWSPDGHWIAYDVDGDLWKIQVDSGGNPVGVAYQLTGEAVYEGRPSWSADGKTIVYHRGDDRETDIWTISAAGGLPIWLTGGNNFADYDPNYSFDGRYVAYSSYTPQGQLARYWLAAFTVYLPPGSLAEGTYPYHFELTWTSPSPGNFLGQAGSVVVSSQAPLYDGCVLLRGLQELAGEIDQGNLNCIEVSQINPDQPVRFLFGWQTETEMTFTEAQAHFASITGQVVWGTSQSAPLIQHEIFAIPADDWGYWYNYVCAQTQKAEALKQIFLPQMMLP